MKNVSTRLKKLTKIICTIGPSCDDLQILEDMVLAGMNVARINFAHGTYEDHERSLLNIRKAEDITGIPITVLQDLSGPKIRVEEMAGGGALLQTGGTICIRKESVVGTSEVFSINTPELIDDIKPQERLFLNDGLLELCVMEKTSDGLIARIESGGILKSKKGVNLPDTKFSIPSITDKDLQDLSWGLQHHVDYFGLSFVSSSVEIKKIRNILCKEGSQAGLIAKIERRAAIDNIEEIIDASDGIMIARGDMGVEIDVTKVPWVQKDIINRCWKKQKPVITATQMLESMVQHARPTRAEVTDVTSAIIDGTDVVMLSAETAVGKYPVETVTIMTRIIETSEKSSSLKMDICDINHQEPHAAYMVCIQGASLAETRATIILDTTGKESVIIAKFDKTKPTIVGVPSIEIARKVSLHHSTIPIVMGSLSNPDKAIAEIIARCKKSELLESGNLVAYIEGHSKADIYTQKAALRLLVIQ